MSSQTKVAGRMGPWRTASLLFDIGGGGGDRGGEVRCHLRMVIGPRRYILALADVGTEPRKGPYERLLAGILEYDERKWANEWPLTEIPPTIFMSPVSGTSPFWVNVKG